MGSSTSASAANDDAVDPNTGLTGQQKKIIVNTWAEVYKDVDANGAVILLTFFDKYPGYQRSFKKFKDVPRQELAENKDFKGHARSVMKALNDVIASIDDPKLMQDALADLGGRHENRGQTVAQFNNLKDVVLEVLKMKFGSDFTAEVEKAWATALGAIFSSITKNFDKAHQ